MMRYWKWLAFVAVTSFFAAGPLQAAEPTSLADFCSQMERDSLAAYQASPFSVLSADCLARYARDPQTQLRENEIELTPEWRIRVASGELAGIMAEHLADFLNRRMQLHINIERLPPGSPGDDTPARTILLLDSGGGDPNTAESYTITVKPDRVVVGGRDPEGLRDGVVKLVDIMGFRQGPFLVRGAQVYKPRLAVRLGTTPRLGSLREMVFLGYNAMLVPGGELFALSTSDAIAELAVRRQPAARQAMIDSVRQAKRYGLKCYTLLSTKQKFDQDDPVFLAHPEIRGTKTWHAEGQYVLCTEHPLVRQYLRESVTSIFQAAPGLDGIAIIIGGEGFYHCFMRSYGAEKGHTTCPRCEALGPDRVVANLCNELTAAARQINPRAEVLAWPYSAMHVWSADAAQSGFIRLLGPGAGILTEMEKDEVITKSFGIRKHLWDYSIDLTGPCTRTRQQIEIAKSLERSVYIKSEPEISLEAPRLAHIPCLDRWAERAEALATCGASGAWVFPAFRPLYGMSSAELPKFLWWEPHPPMEQVLEQLAGRIAGTQAGPHLRKAWQFTSQALGLSPEIPSYYTGPYYLGPAHPMCVDVEASLPEMFSGRYLFMAEMTDADGLRLRPTYITSPANHTPEFLNVYRQMEELMRKAVAEVDAAQTKIDEPHRLTFDAEVSSIRWYYHTVRTTANFHASCQFRDQLQKTMTSPVQTSVGPALFDSWAEVLRDEQDNTTEALMVMERDVRLDYRFGGDHSFSPGGDMLLAKQKLIAHELESVLPELARTVELRATSKPMP